MRVKEKSGKAGLKLHIQNTKILESGPITSWQIDGETVEIVTDYFLELQNKITVDGDCNHEMKRGLLFGGKDMINLNSIFKSRQHLADKCPSSQSYGFSSSHIWMWAKHQRIDAFKLWCWRRLLSPLDSKEIKSVNPKGNQPWIFHGSRVLGMLGLSVTFCIDALIG